MRRRLLALLALVGVAISFGAGCSERRQGRVASGIAERWMRAYNSHDLATFTGLYAEKGHFLMPPMLFGAKTRGDLRRGLDRAWRAYPDMRVRRIDRLVVEGDQVAFAWRMDFTDRASKKKMAFVGATFLKIEGGYITGQWTVFRRQAPPRAGG